MKHTFLVLLIILSTGCVQKSKKSSSSSTSSQVDQINCAQYPYAQQCISSTTGLNGSGSTTGSTSTTGNTGSDPNSQYIPKDNNWQALYGSRTTSPQDIQCAPATGSGYDLRKGTITIAGGDTYYIPGGDFTYPLRKGKSITSPNTLGSFPGNISYHLATTSEAKKFYETDAKLNVRFKVRPQPVPTAGQTWCYNRLTGQNQDTWGYTMLRFSVSAVGLNSNGTIKKNSSGFPIYENTQTVTTNVYTCSPTLNFAGANQRHPYGIVLIVHDVVSDQACWYNNGCTGFKALRQASCWQMDIEAAVDGTKDI